MNFPMFNVIFILIIFNDLGLISPIFINPTANSTPRNGHISHPKTLFLSKLAPRNIQQSPSDTLFHSISPDHWHSNPDSVDYQSELTYDDDHYNHDDYNHGHHDSLMEPFMPMEDDDPELNENQPDDLPSGEIKFADNISLEGEDNLGNTDDDELVLSNFHKTIDDSGYKWNYDNQYPVSDFRCSNKIYAGYYADVQSNCQIWHLCESNGRHHSFSCPNGTLFNQIYRVCDWWYNVDCPKSREYYHINRDQGLIKHNNYQHRFSSVQQPNENSQSVNIPDEKSQLLLDSETTDSEDY